METLDTHHPLLWETGGSAPLSVGVGSHVQGTLTKIHSWGVQSSPQWKLSASQWDTPPRQSSDPAFSKRQGTESYHLHNTASFQRLLPRATLVGISGPAPWIKPSTSQPQLLPGAGIQPWSTQAPAAPRCLPKHKALVLCTRHWTNSSTNKIRRFLHTIRLLKN